MAWTCRFCTNTIVTARYDSYSFIPVNLFQQFQRPANLYFLLISALQCRPELSTATWGTTLTPLLFVLILNGLKEGYDDWKRKSSDKKVASFYKMQAEMLWFPEEKKKIGDMYNFLKGCLWEYKILIQRLDSVKQGWMMNFYRFRNDIVLLIRRDHLLVLCLCESWARSDLNQAKEHRYLLRYRGIKVTTSFWWHLFFLIFNLSTSECNDAIK